ncbi:MAG: FAD-dependent oxidoreductase, partial [Beijerinckiaceae bacterium]
MSVSVEKSGTIAIVTLDSPPVNAIGQEVRAGLLNAVQELAADPSITRVIVTGAGTIFAAGADAREFDGPPLEPHLPDILTLIDASTVPWIAAINGAALGGGYEITLACRYRIAAPAATVGLPEVTLGVIPGAGGTQRLPRLVGIAKAVDVIAQGRVVGAQEALSLGLIDAIDENPVAAARQVDLALLKVRAPLSSITHASPDDAAIEAARAQAAKRMRGQAAPLEAIARVAESATVPFAEALRKERETFIRLRHGDQAKALRHAFFAERQLKPPADVAAAPPADVRHAVVVGGGTMGAGIAYALNSAGLDVTVVETDAAGVARAVANIDKLFADGVKRKILSQDMADARRKSVAVQAGYDALPPAQLAIEAAFESMDVKRQVFAALEKALPADAILATNTSYLDVNKIADSVADPSRVLGLHFFSPAHVMKLLEIVRAERSSLRTLATGYAVGKKLRKISVLAGVCDGFIGNRILASYREIADMVMLDGAMPWDIDAAMVNFGYPMGPYEAQDLSGLDIAYANRKRLAPTRDPQRRYVPIADRLVEA